VIAEAADSREVKDSCVRRQQALNLLEGKPVDFLDIGREGE
jgi:hypothetical protein